MQGKTNTSNKIKYNQPTGEKLFVIYIRKILTSLIYKKHLLINFLKTTTQKKIDIEYICHRLVNRFNIFYLTKK